MADKKLNPEELLSTSGGSKELAGGPGKETHGDSLARLRNLLTDEDDYSRVRKANLSSKDLARILGAGTTAVANALAASGVQVKRRDISPPVAEYREDKEMGV